MPKIDIAKIPVDTVCMYPEPFWKPIVGRERKRLGNAVGLDQFGVNLVTLKPGSWSSQRHWHRNEDEFVYVLEGEITLVEDHGETVLKPGDAAGWRANGGIGHCLINRTDKDALYLEVGTRSKDERVHYPDVDFRLERDDKGRRWMRKSGEPIKE